MQDLLGIDGVLRCTVDQCRYGMADEKGQPIKKPTSFMTNSPCLAEELNTRCGGKNGMCGRSAGGVHTLRSGKRARLAAIYHFDLCKAILTGFRRQMEADGRCKPGCVGMIATEVETEDVIPMLHIGMTESQAQRIQASGEEIFRDDMTGQLLSPELVMAAREK